MNKIEKQSVVVKIPASTANLGPGFDALGMALSLYAWLELTVADETEVHLYGDGMEGIPTDHNNLVYKVAQKVFARVGMPEQALKISMYSDIPLTRGLGSSASAIVGALVAANALIGQPLTTDELFHMATELEGHPDNVGASIFGGIVISSWDEKTAPYVKITPPITLETLVVVPDFQLSTEKARHALPSQYSKADVVFNIGRSSLLVAALASGQLELIRTAMQDRIHQPYRAALIPGMEYILEHATEKGALGAALSGAGPTLITFVDSQSTQQEELEQFLLECMKKEGITATTMWLSPDIYGARVIYESNTQGETIAFMDLVKGDGH
ncbi:homoserine kinase [Paenibacillus endoradicis]|uniref:homoserine kinase n=1 Tax=Paenibacillus endoradicis TaxID=2972487 RepID=UPI002158E8F3|nr:homoserine kinase [Paenibacillus endoradicis]MCR8655720.1 homoserine kinase [Paenibacillus endoradicis]MCR8658046.1 homoserine kinase [Paenibacillus endoradicis]